MGAELNLSSIDLSSGEPLATTPLSLVSYQLPTVLVRLLRNYFAAGPYLIPALNELRYLGSDEPQSRTQVQKALEIERLTTYRGDEISQGPKILIREDAVALVRRGIAGGLRQAPATANPFGSRLYEKLWAGSLVIFAMSSVADESRLIALEVASLLAHFQEDIRKEIGSCEAFRVTQVGATGKVKEFPTFFGTPVPIDYAYTENVAISPRRLPIREIVLSIQAQ